MEHLWVQMEMMSSVERYTMCHTEPVCYETFPPTAKESGRTKRCHPLLSREPQLSVSMQTMTAIPLGVMPADTSNTKALVLRSKLFLPLETVE